jgi:hypothetical protein
LRAMLARAAKFSAECTVGRLVEARLDWLNSAGDVADFVRAMQIAFAKAGPACVICGDWRAASVMPPDVGDALIGLLRRGNKHFKRSAVLLSGTSGTLNLQVERLFREASNDERRAFKAPPALLQWLAEVLTPVELQRAADFLHCPVPSLSELVPRQSPLPARKAH